jgi:hypothetical protein
LLLTRTDFRLPYAPAEMEEHMMRDISSGTFLLARGGRLFGSGLQRLVHRIVLRRTRLALLNLNDHMLRDIGLTRQDVEFGCFGKRDRL